MTTFTASEVRRLSDRIPHSNDEIADAQEALRAFADMLEADEKAVPTGFVSAGSLLAFQSCRNDEYNGTVNLWMRPNEEVRANVPLYTHPAPADAERLAEALKLQIAKWRGSHRLDCNEGERAVLNSCALEIESILQALAAYDAHSAQAQPPAASVPDAIARRMVAEYDAVLCGDPTATRTDGMRAALEAALAAQESLNGL